MAVIGCGSLNYTFSEILIYKSAEQSIIIDLSLFRIWILKKRFSFILLLFVESASQWNWNMKFLKAYFSSVNIQIISNAEQALFSWNITYEHFKQKYSNKPVKVRLL